MWSSGLKIQRGISSYGFTELPNRAGFRVVERPEPVLRGYSRNATALGADRVQEVSGPTLILAVLNDLLKGRDCEQQLEMVD